MAITKILMLHCSEYLSSSLELHGKSSSTSMSGCGGKSTAHSNHSGDKGDGEHHLFLLVGNI